MEAVVFCGIPASGKSSFYVARFFDTHVRISQDLLRTHNRIRRLFDVCLETRQPFVVDRLNPTPEERLLFAGPARAAGFRTAAYWFDTAPREAIGRNARRDARTRVPVPAILGTARRLVPPGPEEPFDVVYRVRPGAGGGFAVERFAGTALVAP